MLEISNGNQQELHQLICPDCETCWEIEPAWMSFKCGQCRKQIEIMREDGIEVNLSGGIPVFGDSPVQN